MRFKEFGLNENWFTDLFKRGNDGAIKVPTTTSGPEISALQQALQGLGFSVGPPGIDGKLGPYTRNALARYQASRKVPVTNNADATTVARINTELKSNPDLVKKIASTPAQTKGLDTSSNASAQGLIIKSSEALAGGGTKPLTFEVAHIIQNNIRQFKQFTAFDDAFHHHVGYRSAHTSGTALDFTIKNPAESAAVTREVISLLADAGYLIKIINEYARPSAKATGGHIHIEVLGKRPRTA